VTFIVCEPDRVQIQCECGQFKAEWAGFPKATPGRAVCYCDDCQSFMHYMQRTDLLDPAGGTEIVPAYPADLHITAGKDVLRCTRLAPKGLMRWSTACCNTPIGNTAPGFPWVGLIHCVFKRDGASSLNQALGPVKSRIMGRFASVTPPAGTSAKLSLRDMRVVMPFILRGFLFGKRRGSPFFEADGKTPIVKPYVLSLQERNAIRCRLKPLS
jgi:hypothetical protein